MRAIELCAGFGGVGVGLSALGFEIVRAYDSWDEAVAIYNHNVVGNRSVVCNLTTAPGFSMVKADRVLWQGVDLLAAGPPCKGFSQLRNGKHDGRNGHNRVLAAMPDY